MTFEIGYILRVYLYVANKLKYPVIRVLCSKQDLEQYFEYSNASIW